MLEQTVPSTGSGNREGLITDGGQPCTTDIQRQVDNEEQEESSIHGNNMGGVKNISDIRY